MLYRPNIKLLGKKQGDLFGLVIVEYIFATYLWLSSCLLSPLCFFFLPLTVCLQNALQICLT